MVWRALLALLSSHVGLAQAFKSTSNLPGLLVFENGTAISSTTQWAARRDELKSLTQEHILGSFVAFF